MQTTTSIERNLAQRIAAYAVNLAMVLLFILWFVFGHMDVPVVKTRFVEGFAAPGLVGGPTNAYGGPGDLVFDAFSTTRLFFAAFAITLIVFAATPLIGLDNSLANDAAIFFIAISLFLKFVLVFYMLFVWSSSYNRVGQGFVGNFFNDRRACCVPAISASVDNRCPNGLPNYAVGVPCSPPLSLLTLDDLSLNESAVLFIVVIVLQILGDIILFFAAFLSRETNFSTIFQNALQQQIGIGEGINRKKEKFIKFK